MPFRLGIQEAFCADSAGLKYLAQNTQKKKKRREYAIARSWWRVGATSALFLALSRDDAGTKNRITRTGVYRQRRRMPAIVLLEEAADCFSGDEPVFRGMSVAICGIHLNELNH